MPQRRKAADQPHPDQPDEKLLWRPGTMLYPLPVVLVGCGVMGGAINLITIGWTGIICSDPPMCHIAVRPERHSHALLVQNPEFSINLTTVALAFATDWCGVKSGRDVDKFAAMGLTAMAGTQISAPLLAESPVNLECRITERKPLGSHDLFLAEIVAVHASGRYFDARSGAFHLDQAQPICFAHGKYYKMGALIGKFGFSVEKKIKHGAKTRRA